MIKNPKWQEANQLAIYKHGWGVELGTTEKQIQLVLVARAGLELETSRSRLRGAAYTRPRCLPWSLEDSSEPDLCL